MLKIRLFNTSLPLPPVQDMAIRRLLEDIGGKLVSCGEAECHGYQLIYIEAEKPHNRMQGWWLDAGDAIYPMTFRIINGPGRDTGWCQPTLVDDEHREVADHLRRVMETGDFKMIPPLRLALTA